MRIDELKAKLTSLGSTVAEVRTNLRQLGFIAMSDKLGCLTALPPKQRNLMPSYVSRSCNCPVALYLRTSMFGCTHASVSAEQVVMRFSESGSEMLSVVPPLPIQEFIKADDKRLERLRARA